MEIGDFINDQPIVKIEETKYGNCYIDSLSNRYYSCESCGCILKEGWSHEPGHYVCGNCAVEADE